jgi:membrane protease YdiL (CAAX protease family)
VSIQEEQAPARRLIMSNKFLALLLGAVLPLLLAFGSWFARAIWSFDDATVVETVTLQVEAVPSSIEGIEALHRQVQQHPRWGQMAWEDIPDPDEREGHLVELKISSIEGNARLEDFELFMEAVAKQGLRVRSFGYRTTLDVSAWRGPASVVSTTLASYGAQIAFVGLMLFWTGFGAYAPVYNDRVRVWKVAAAVFFVVLACSVLISVAYHLYCQGAHCAALGLPTDQSFTTRQWLALLVLAVVIAPLAEEFVWRRWSIEVLAKAFPAPLAILVSSLAFAWLHVPAAPWMYTYFVAYGLCLGYLWHATRSFVACVAVHALLNAFVVLQMALLIRA